MEAQTRADLAATSVQTRNKKLAQILENRDIFVQAFKDLRDEIGDGDKSFQESSDAALVNTYKHFLGRGFES